MLTVNEAANYLRIEPNVLRCWLREGKFPGVKTGVNWRVDETDLQKFIEEAKRKPGKGE
ncbi:MAG: helix-turn-helix domain-containing protein [Bacillota bacterium]